MINGHFIISLDFELYWGVRDIKSLDEYGKNIEGVHRAIPLMLELFNEFGVVATFATVGMLFHKNKEELKQHIPSILPSYDEINLSPYDRHFNQIPEDGSKNVFHFAPHLIDLISSQPQHEIGTHTYSHYYCLEPGQTTDSFKADLVKAIECAKQKNIQLQSLVFPRNQFNEAYLSICKELGILSYRGNEPFWFYKASAYTNENAWKRAFRLIDSYLPLSGHNCFDISKVSYVDIPINIPSSRFLRPYQPRLSFLDDLKINRITSGMSYAAKNNMAYHLWWHPHNFGVYLEENLRLLRRILSHYKNIQERYGIQSITMTALAKKIIHGQI